MNGEEENDPFPDEIKPVSLRRVKSKGFSLDVSMDYLFVLRAVCVAEADS